MYRGDARKPTAGLKWKCMAAGGIGETPRFRLFRPRSTTTGQQREGVGGWTFSAERAAIYRSNTRREKAPIYFPSEANVRPLPLPLPLPTRAKFQFVRLNSKPLYLMPFPPVSRRLTVRACNKNLDESIVLNRYTYPLLRGSIKIPSNSSPPPMRAPGWDGKNGSPKILSFEF